MFLSFLLLKTIGTIINFAIVFFIGVLGVTNILPTVNFDIAYVVKYFIFLYTLYQLFLDSKLDLYHVKDNKKLVAHLLADKENQNEKREVNN